MNEMLESEIASVTYKTYKDPDAYSSRWKLELVLFCFGEESADCSTMDLGYYKATGLL